MAKKKNIKQKANIYHNYYKRTGLYKIIGKSVFKIVVILIVLIVAGLSINKYFNLEQFFTNLVEQLNPYLVYLVFLSSETLLGLVPPDIFIIWGKHFDNPYLIVTFLATLSYLGGIFSYKIGLLIRRIPRVNRYVEKIFKKNYRLIEKFGGAIIVVAALFPLPYSTISMIAGAVKYKYKTFLLFGLTRFLRFYLYAIVLYSLKIF